MNNPFTKHPHSIGETYIQHMGHALGFGLTFLILTIVAITHAIFPFAFIHTGSNKIKELHSIMQKRRK